MKLWSEGACFLLFLIIVCYGFSGLNAAKDCRYTVVLLGSTGDLARRYIWPALYENNLHIEALKDESCNTIRFMIFGVTRSEITDREALLSKTLVNIKCTDNAVCDDLKRDFVNSISFVKLRTEQDYEELSEQIETEYTHHNTRELGRVIYLAIPPSAYATTVGYISFHLKPKTESTWLRVVLEKPFGRNLTSAFDLNEGILKHLDETEVYRIDHYLGKFGVKQLRTFLRQNNEVLSSVWNRNGIQSIEVAMEEALDVRSRGKFYDANGVLRDVHQNHLTEVLALLLMDPLDSHGAEKVRVLSSLFSPRLHHTVLGQYIGYQDHLEEDGISTNSHTPTYATVVLHSKDSKWRGCPFVLTSGKQMSQRRAFARVLFKDTVFSDWTKKLKCPAEIRFVIQGDGQKPGILVSNHLSGLGLKFNVQLKAKQYTESECDYTLYEPTSDVTSNSYVSLIDAILRDKREYFVGSEGLLESWRIWTPLLDQIDLTQSTPIPYTPDSVPGYSIHGTKLVTSANVEEFDFISDLPHFAANSVFNTEHRVITADKYQLSSLLVEDMLRAASESIKLTKSFHLALPGGTSPLLVMDLLALDYHHSFPWQHTHIWQTDERCVDSQSAQSNIRQLSEHLISHVDVPYLNIHPMPVHLGRGLCVHEDNGSGLYEQQLSAHAPEGRLDYILLGVGTDGHVASVFPVGDLEEAESEDLLEEHTKERYVEIVRTSSVSRMTLTLNCILKARKIGLIFVGDSKREIVQIVQKCVEIKNSSECEKLPMINLIQKTREQQLSMYIDSALL